MNNSPSSNYLENVVSAIQEIEAVNRKESWAYERIHSLIVSIPKLPVFIYTIPKGNGRFIFRSRVNPGTELFSSKRDLTCPPKDFVCYYGRANKPRQSLFYGSQTRPVSYGEFTQYLASKINISEEALITIGKWSIKDELNLALVFDPNTMITEELEESRNAFFKFRESSSAEFREGIDRFFEFFGNEYSKLSEDRDTDYLVSCAYSNVLFGDARIDGILYPSVQLNGQGMNIVLKEDYVKSGKIELEDVWVDKFRKRLLPNGKPEFLNIAGMGASELMYDTIKWENPWEEFL